MSRRACRLSLVACWACVACLVNHVARYTRTHAARCALLCRTNMRALPSSAPIHVRSIAFHPDLSLARTAKRAPRVRSAFDDYYPQYSADFELWTPLLKINPWRRVGVARYPRGCIHVSPIAVGAPAPAYRRRPTSDASAKAPRRCRVARDRFHICYAVRSGVKHRRCRCPHLRLHFPWSWLRSGRRSLGT